MNPDLRRERANCPFEIEEITNLLNGGPQKTQLKRSILQKIIKSEAFRECEQETEAMSAKERYEYSLKMGTNHFRTAFKLARETGSLDDLALISYLGRSVLTPEGSPLSLHTAMFIPALRGQASKEQADYWLTRALNMDIIGTYAQTELGHGTFLRGLETTATYDAATEEFVLHSPSTSAYKWWPGGLGKTANHAVVMCQLVINGERKGPHPFIVQLRDMETHTSLMGIDIGEIGHKLSFNSYDNGFLGFNQVRIPRDRLLNRNAKVMADGTYVKPPYLKSSYATMILVRVQIAISQVEQIQKAVTIAIRYSAVRRQSELRPGDPEPQIMDFQTQQWKLFPHLALSFGFHFAAEELQKTYNIISKEVNAGTFQSLPELHALSCGLKAMVTSEGANGIDVLRRACGGHGFMSASGLPRIWGLSTAACTYEGENTVLLLQVARFLYKSYHQSLKNPLKKLPQSVSYLNINGLERTDLGSPQNLVSMFSAVAKGHLTQTSKQVDLLIEQGLHPSDAWNSCSQELTEVSLSHLRCFVISSFETALRTKVMSNEVLQVLSTLMRLSALFWIKRHLGDFIAHANLQPTQLALVNQTIAKVLSDVRPVAVSLVDAFDFPDEVLQSTLGAHDGNVYERMLAKAKKGAMNQEDVQPAFEKFLKPLMKSNL